jgi:hypothetical protein
VRSMNGGRVLFAIRCRKTEIARWMEIEDGWKERRREGEERRRDGTWDMGDRLEEVVVWFVEWAWW